MTDLRVTCTHCVHGRVEELSSAAVDKAHRLHAAFRAHLKSTEQLSAIEQLVALLQPAPSSDNELIAFIPQVVLLLKRSLKILMDSKTRARWRGVWNEPEPTTEELAALVEPHAVTLREEPWQRHFFESTIALLARIENPDLLVEEQGPAEKPPAAAPPSKLGFLRAVQQSAAKSAQATTV